MQNARGDLGHAKRYALVPLARAQDGVDRQEADRIGQRLGAGLPLALDRLRDLLRDVHDSQPFSVRAIAALEMP